MYQMRLTLYLKQWKCHSFPRAITSTSRGKEHAAHVVMTEADVTDTLAPVLEPESEVAVEDCLDVRNLALNRFFSV